MYNYIYVEEISEYDICYETKKDYFKCVGCTFRSCCSCLDHFYFENDTGCPTCKLISMLF